MSGLTMSPDGRTLVVSVSRPDTSAHRYQSALYSVDPAGERPAVRLTRGAAGEAAAAFTHQGDLLFTSKRSDPESRETEERSSVWILPNGQGEARILTTRAGGFSGILAARQAPVVVFPAGVLPGATDPGDDALRKARKEAGVWAILHDGYPVRYWDHDLGPDHPHLLTADLSDPDRLTLRDLTPAPGGALIEQSSDVSPDGSRIASGWHRPIGRGDQRSEIVLIDVASGERTVVASDPDADLEGPRFSADGTRIVYRRERRSTPDSAPSVGLRVLDLADGTVIDPAPDWDRWPSGVAWTPDGSHLVVTADQDGRGPLFVIPSGGGAVRTLTDDEFAYSDAVVSPDGRFVYAMRAGYLAPSHPVRVALAGDGPSPAVPLPAPVELPALPGTLVDVRTQAADGTAVRGWLALPHGAGPDHPAPLLLWIHGGPLASWNAWSWRWTPWIMVAAGYAVLLPDPALSTGYGQEFVQRGWGNWGQAPYTDLMSITDAVVARPDIDDTRTAAMGGSFGGYMANWVAGHTDRFRAIVTHASLWSLEEFGPTTDVASYWGREMSPRMMAENSPHAFAESISTPMLVVHGDKDYRVPIGQGIRLWYDLLSKSALAADDDGNTPHRFLYFPSENHWVLTPGHAKVWYQVVLGFLAEHVLHQSAAALPPLLGGPAKKDGDADA
ncbi:S9 family peptidase [Nakamurella panacisegetis]